ncbi:hypothetical protein [Ornithinimicrobium cryptoxanthini]|uniref:hypothetical protein n=1 Tax=Ornithinimicrobium cryptoxanthini TaxID=2934161 RepID=UPI002118447E|nr:hypothetical protein [Ornithinimicrobium cryptoxanthini]
MKFATATVAAGPYSALRPYEFDRSRYRRSFLAWEPPATPAPSNVPRRVFTAWTGDNDITPARAANLERMQETLGIPVDLVTPANLGEWVVDGHPIHRAYQHLSFVHRSDYLRAYLMHHHGGGWSDIKAPQMTWAPFFSQMELDDDAWLMSFQELSADSVARLPGRLGLDVALHHPRLVGSSAMICRSYTPFTAEWLRQVDLLLDYFGPQAADHPGGIRGEVVGYPVSWTDLLGKVYHPLQLKYLEHVRVENGMLLNFTDYQ